MMTFNPCTNTIKVIMAILVLLTEEMGSEFNNLPEAIDLVMAQKPSELWSLGFKGYPVFLICKSENGKMNELGRSREEEENVTREERFSLQIPDQED